MELECSMHMYGHYSYIFNSLISPLDLHGEIGKNLTPGKNLLVVSFMNWLSV